MSVFQKWAPDMVTYTDPVTGAEVTQLTTYRGNHNHLYFTNPGWYDNNRKLVIDGDRDNRRNLFSVDLETFEITQLTDLPEHPMPCENNFQLGAVDGVRNMAYVYSGRDVLAVDLMTCAVRKLWTMPEGFIRGNLNCSQDADYVYNFVYEDLSRAFNIDLFRGYMGFRELFEYGPLSRIYRIRTDGSGAEMIHEEKCWIGHVNVAPTNEDRITFCHEGPWKEVDNRIWAMEVSSGKIWKIHPCAPGDTVGHEYWHADSKRIGFHGQKGGVGGYLGTCSFEDEGCIETTFPTYTGHIHSLDDDLIVGDEGKHLRLWKREGDRYIGPKMLCEHRCSFKSQRDHVHPCFSPDGKSILFTSDRSGYTSVYLVKLKDFDSLPNIE